MGWIETAVEPLRDRLPAAAYARLVSALAVCAGIEAMVVLRDIRGQTSAQATETSRWMAGAVLKETMRDARAARRRRRK